MESVLHWEQKEALAKIFNTSRAPVLPSLSLFPSIPSMLSLSEDHAAPAAINLGVLLEKMTEVSSLKEPYSNRNGAGWINTTLEEEKPRVTEIEGLVNSLRKQSNRNRMEVTYVRKGEMHACKT